jgi:hypothetical protein
MLHDYNSKSSKSRSELECVRYLTVLLASQTWRRASGKNLVIPAYATSWPDERTWFGRLVSTMHVWINVKWIKSFCDHKTVCPPWKITKYFNSGNCYVHKLMLLKLVKIFPAILQPYILYQIWKPFKWKTKLKKIYLRILTINNILIFKMK